MCPVRLPGVPRWARIEGLVGRSLRAGSAADRANGFVVIVLALQRLSYVLPAVLTLHSHPYRSPVLHAGLVGATAAWNVVLFASVRSRGFFPARMVWLDVGWTVVLFVAVAANSAPTDPYAALSWARRMGQAGAALAGAAIGPIPLAAVAVAVIGLGYLVAGVAGPAGDPPVEAAGYINGLVWFAVFFGFVLRFLRTQGRRLDTLAAERTAAEARRAAAQASHDARMAHLRALHDTVLGTLIAIARGGLDHRSDEVRRRCARDADYVRRLLRDDPGTDGLAHRLAEVAGDVEALGVRVHFRHHELPEEIAPDAVAAICGATREALNNVVKHAGVTTCWVTAQGVGDRLVVRVVDRGAGFDATTTPPGFGLPFSLVDGMRTVGGAARVSSAPGDGTTVELAWPA